ncbi:MAG: S41 family peptidase [Verrucomicrobiae bacterium]|nr:S41 family peptidase [Verrucomicrobiae bacterium]
MKQRLLYAAFVACLGGYVFIGSQVFEASAAKDKADDAYEQLELFSRVLERVRRDYADGDKLTYEELVHGALRGMLNSLDPHSEFMEPVAFDELKEDTEGQFSGVGMQVSQRDDQLFVVAPMEDTPAFEAGIMAGDRIAKIDGKSTDGMTVGDAVKLLRGVPRTKVTVSVERPGTEQLLDFPLTRQRIQVHTAKDINNRREFPLDDSKVGYIRLTQFGERTAEELEEALQKLERQGMKALILDLRGNPGGLLDQAVAVSEKFVEKGKPIVSTRGRNPANDVERRASGGGRKRISEKLPMAILINGGSASASEIVSGALQDLKRAVVVGEQSFGKGSVQSVMPLPDGSALRLTTAKYYTPSLKVIHGQGITPDVIVPLSEDEEIAIQLARLPGGEANLELALKAFPAERQERLHALVAERRDAQRERARDLLKGLTLYGRRTGPVSGEGAEAGLPGEVR